MSNRSLLVLAILSFAAPAFAADRNVPSATYPTIAAAVAAAQPGDRIKVGPGVYQEHVVSAVANLQFLGRNAVWDGTLTDGTAGVCLTATGGGTVVQGFTFRAGQGGAAQIQLTGDDCRVLKCASRGPNGRFVKITGNRALVDTCTLFAVDSTAVEIVGNNALVQKVKTRQCDDNVVSVSGDDATVAKCAFVASEDSYSVLIVGNRALVSKNTFLDCDDCLSVTGDDAVVENNTASHCGDLAVEGDSLTIRRNKIDGTVDDSNGFDVTSRTPTGAGTIEDNKVTGTVQTGLYVRCNNVTVRRNKVVNCGTEGGESGVQVSGRGNNFSDNTVTGGGTHGFDVSGADNTFFRCTSSDNAADGFHVTGAGTTLSSCKAELNTGEGLDNGGGSTSVAGCTFKKNRIDVANDGTITNAASFADENTFTTGGTTQAPQVD
jgi:hypothetical protein